jgi:hypothetical protein
MSKIEQMPGWLSELAALGFDDRSRCDALTVP